MSAAPRNTFAVLDTTTRADDDVLAATGLSVAYRVRSREREVLSDVTFRIRRGEAYGLVGESGCGKSTLALAALSYLPRNGRIKSGRIAIAGADLATLDAEALRMMRAKTVSMVYQDPSRALNPSLTVGIQVSEAFEVAYAISREEARTRARQMLARVHIASPDQVMDRYPHQLSGGMQQRVVIAMALASNPALLVLDEPTTGLDATVEAEVLDLVTQLRNELGTAVLFISHNLAVIGRMCSRVGVLYAGRLVEEGASADVFGAPHHPYTVGLLRCLPARARSKSSGRLDTISGSLPAPGMAVIGCAYAERCKLADERCRREAPPPYRFGAAHGVQMARCHYHENAQALPFDMDSRPHPPSAHRDASSDRAVAQTTPVLRAEHVSKTFVGSAQTVRAVDDVSLTLGQGETLGLVGESGSGKTTLARLLVGLIAPDRGATIELDGKSLQPRVERRNGEQLKSLQIVFQNPDSALNRAHSVRHLIGRALSKLGMLRGAAHGAELSSLADAVRLPRRYLDARTRQLSGGLKQRVAIARAFAGDPRVVVCDEPTSSLDVSVQAAILNLLVDLQRERGVSYVFISHDLHVVRYISDRIAVLYAGRLLEIGFAQEVFDGPHHPYTEALLSAMPPFTPGVDDPHNARVRLCGEPLSSTAPPTGCVFQTRCARKLGELCEKVDPPFADAGAGHLIRCHIPVSELRDMRHEPQGV
ncbi:ABC transporter ATP-binding protein [Trinickia sp. LjRoot230]|uniref:ABC transporter ATP-binding protein n=1 Tax=Trinickia sp. LjRoot230 TaxID=3342288 RepID=UPI003ECEBA05